MYATPVSSVPTVVSQPVLANVGNVPTPPATIETPIVEEHSPYTMLIVGGLIFVIILVVIGIAREYSEEAHLLPPHLVHIPPPQSAIASAQGPLNLPFPPPAPYAIPPNNTCIPGSFYYPSCLTQTPVQFFASGDPYCVSGSPYWPLCRVTQTHPLAAYRY